MTDLYATMNGELAAKAVLDVLNARLRAGDDPLQVEAGLVAAVTSVFSAIHGQNRVPERLRTLADEIEQAARLQ